MLTRVWVVLTNEVLETNEAFYEWQELVLEDDHPDAASKMPQMPLPRT